MQRRCARPPVRLEAFLDGILIHAVYETPFSLLAFLDEYPFQVTYLSTCLVISIFRAWRICLAGRSDALDKIRSARLGARLRAPYRVQKQNTPYSRADPGNTSQTSPSPDHG